MKNSSEMPAHVETWRKMLQDPKNGMELAIVSRNGEVGPWTSNSTIMRDRIKAQRSEATYVEDREGWTGAIRSSARFDHVLSLTADELEAVVAPVKMPPQAVYDALHAACADTIQAFRTDLEVHDKRWIMENTDGEGFLHFAYGMGSYIVALPPADSPRWGSDEKKTDYLLVGSSRRNIVNDALPAFVKAIQRNFEPTVIHHFTGSEVKPISMDQAFDIATDHAREVWSAWQSQKSALRNTYALAAETPEAGESLAV